MTAHSCRHVAEDAKGVVALPMIEDVAEVLCVGSNSHQINVDSGMGPGDTDQPIEQTINHGLIAAVLRLSIPASTPAPMIPPSRDSLK